MRSRISNCKAFSRLGAIKQTGHQLIERGCEQHPRVLYIWFVTIAAGFGAVIGAVKAVPFVRRQLRTRSHLPRPKLGMLLGR